jgi:hypothetical protein
MRSRPVTMRSQRVVRPVSRAQPSINSQFSTGQSLHADGSGPTGTRAAGGAAVWTWSRKRMWMFRQRDRARG